MKKYLNKNHFKKMLILLFLATAFTACKKNEVITPAFTVTPNEGAGNGLITLTGTNLKDIRSIVFDLGNVNAPFNPNFNTDNAILFRVPAAANVGEQHIVFTNANGYQFSTPFKVLAIPTLSAAQPAEWEAGNTITITGNYLATTSHVALIGSSDTATIVSASATQLVIRMPASTVPTAQIAVTNDAGTTNSTFFLVNMDQQFKLFTEDYGPGIQDWSWNNSSKSNAFAISGTNALKEVFSKGGYQGMSFHYDFNIVASAYQTLSLWIKGGADDNKITVFPDAVVSGSVTANPVISVPANVWTHITIPMSTWSGVTFQRFDFQITGPATADETLYFDNVILIK